MIGYMDMTFCMDRKCLRTVCHRHQSHIPEDYDGPVAMSPFENCEDRICMKGDWPTNERMNNIGRNGNNGDHYD